MNHIGDSLPRHAGRAAELTGIDSAVDQLVWVAGRFNAAASGGSLLDAVNGIRSLLNLLDHPQRPDVPGSIVEHVEEAITITAPIIASAGSPLSPEHVTAGLVHVVAILGLFGRANGTQVGEQAFREIQDHIDHAALIADELDAVLRRRLIAAREASPSPSGGSTARSLH